MWKEDLLDRPTPQTQQQAYKVPSSQRVLNEEKYCHVVVSQAFVAGVQTTTDQQNILVLWHMSHLPPASAKKSSSKLHSETSFYQYVLVDGKITSFDFVAFDVQIDMEDGEGDGDDGAAVHLVVVITKLNEVFKWSFVVSTSSWETMLSMEYHSLSNVPVSVIKLHPLGYLSVSMEKGKAIVRNEVLEKENVLTLDCAGSGSSKIGQLCYYPVRIQQTTAAATGRRRVQSDASMELHVLFILFEDGNIQVRNSTACVERVSL